MIVYHYLELPQFSLQEMRETLNELHPTWATSTQYFTQVNKGKLALQWVKALTETLGQSYSAVRIINESPGSAGTQTRIHKDGVGTFAINVPIYGFDGELLWYKTTPDQHRLEINFPRKTVAGTSQTYTEHIAPWHENKKVIAHDAASSLKLFNEVGEYVKDWKPMLTAKINQPIIHNTQVWHAGRNLSPDQRLTMSLIYVNLSIAGALERLTAVGWVRAGKQA